MKTNKLRLPWRQWDLHVVDCDENGVAWNVGVERARYIAESVNRFDQLTKAVDRFHQGIINGILDI